MKYLSLLLSFFSINANAQALFSQKFNDCTKEKPCYYCGDTVAHYKKRLNEQLQRSLNTGLQRWMGTSGSMYFEVEIDSTGHSCVKSTRDDIPMSDVRNTLRMSINQLYDWQPAILNGHPINSTVIIKTRFLGDRANITFVKPEEVTHP